jgi:hydroxymethylpyrimidine kinase/phosphomethylpyrimidine kinase
MSAGGMKYILAIGGSDPSGGAGVQADVKTIAGLGSHALTVITCVTVQNSLGLVAVHRVPPTFIYRQMSAVVEQVTPDAVKIGMMYAKGAVKTIADWLKNRPLPNVVLDPVIHASAGGRLLTSEALSLLRKELLPLAAVVTPNLQEAGILTGKPVRTEEQMIEAAREICDMGPQVVVTGGHLAGECVDILFDRSTIHRFAGDRIDTPHTHGSGCVFSSALATYLAAGLGPVAAVEHAGVFARRAVSRGYACGKGAGPVRPWT